MALSIRLILCRKLAHPSAETCLTAKGGIFIGNAPLRSVVRDGAPGSFLAVRGKQTGGALNLSTSSHHSAKQVTLTLDDEEFRVLVIPGHTKVPEKKKEERAQRREVAPPRYKSMKLDQDWTDVWPSAQSFKWSVVPFPVRQGYIEKSENDGIPPGKYANAELMKIPNFLHLTPNHVKKHCAALKELCTDWPKGLGTDAECDTHFPIEVITRDYLTDSASVRDVRARPVTIKVKLSSLALDYHAQDKLIRLAGLRYNADDDTLTLETNRCPLKIQNYDYAKYLLTVLYSEAWKVEGWESETTLADMEKYFWDLNPSKTTIIRTLRTVKQRAADAKNNAKIPAYVESLPTEPTDEQIASLPLVQQYKAAIEELWNGGEDLKALDRYKDAVKRLLLSTQTIS